MEAAEATIPFPDCANVPADIAATSTIVEEGPRICPLCNSIVKLFFINLNEKILMCENTECEFPFGHEDLHFVKENNEVQSNEELISVRSKASLGSPTGSIISAAAWSEIDKINKVYDSEDSQFDVRTVRKDCGSNRKTNLKKLQMQRENEQEIQKHLADIKEMNMELNEVEDKPACIEKENWLKNLMSLQELTGQKLLRQKEIEKLKTKEPPIGLGELTIDIDSGSDMSSIKIEITNNLNGSEKNK